MKLLSAAQIRNWDEYTIQHEPVSSIDLMERAAKACVQWLLQHAPEKCFYIFCSTGNNGGDGLAIARLLHEHHIKVKVFVLFSSKESDDFKINLERLKKIAAIEIVSVNSELSFPAIDEGTIIIDALFGTGLNRKTEGLAVSLINYLNHTGKTIIAIDIPSGLLCDSSSKGFTIIEAMHTLSFQCYKLALLIPENEIYFGVVHILDIQLHQDFLNTINPELELTDAQLVQQIYKPRKAFSHKGAFGHALIIAGSYSKMGAAVLSTRACLRSGAGLVTAHIPQCGLDILQVSAPEAMCKVDTNTKTVSAIDYDLNTYSAIGIGPGIEKATVTARLLQQLIITFHQPMVIDADALNILSENKEWLSLLPENTILTPHPKEFTRLFEDSTNDFDKVEMALQQAREHKIIIVLKGHRSFIATPAGKGYFNTTGNVGMATGGSGDVLTGVITGLLAQGYTPAYAAILGVYIHGLAGDNAAEKYGFEAMIAGDLVEELNVAKRFNNQRNI